MPISQGFPRPFPSWRHLTLSMDEFHQAQCHAAAFHPGIPTAPTQLQYAVFDLAEQTFPLAVDERDEIRAGLGIVILRQPEWGPADAVEKTPRSSL